jgi:hypothetical protein
MLVESVAKTNKERLFIGDGPVLNHFRVFLNAVLNQVLSVFLAANHNTPEEVADFGLEIGVFAEFPQFTKAVKLL